MSPEVTTEYKKQLALQDWPAMHTKLALMDNPYSKLHKVIRKKLKKEGINIRGISKLIIPKLRRRYAIRRNLRIVWIFLLKTT